MCVANKNRLGKKIFVHKKDELNTQVRWSPRIEVLRDVCKSTGIHRVIHKSLVEFRTRLRNNQDRHGRKEHINR